jgi:Flp pilus assembly pilin Flp
MLNSLRGIWSHDDGGELAEYALLAAVILLFVMSSALAIGTNAKTVFTTIFKSVAGQLSAS